jgi:chromosome segregation ATPase
MLNGQIISDSELSGKLVKNEELFNHEYLYNRNAADAHPIQAITGLKEKLTELENKAPMEFQSIKAEISRLLISIANESTRARTSEKQLQAEIATITKALTDIQNDEELEKITLDIIKLKTENLELKTELVEAINKVSEGLVEQISLLQDLSVAVDTRVTDLTKADIELKETFSEKFINTEASISTNTNTIIEIEKRVASQETALAELRTELEALNSTPEAPSSGLLDLLIKTFVTTEDIVTVEQNIADLENRITDLESSINGEAGILARLDILDAQATVVETLAENIQTLSRDFNNSNLKIDINEDNIEDLKEKLQNIQLDTESNTTNISTVKSEIESVKTLTETLEKSVNTNKVNIEELSSTQDQLTELQTDIIKLRSELILKIQSETALLDISLDKVTNYIATLNTST